MTSGVSEPGAPGGRSASALKATREGPGGSGQVSRLGIEPRTYGLKVRCSTN